MNTLSIACGQDSGLGITGIGSITSYRRRAATASSLWVSRPAKLKETYHCPHQVRFFTMTAGAAH